MFKWWKKKKEEKETFKTNVNIDSKSEEKILNKKEQKQLEKEIEKEKISVKNMLHEYERFWGELEKEFVNSTKTYYFRNSLYDQYVNFKKIFNSLPSFTELQKLDNETIKTKFYIIQKLKFDVDYFNYELKEKGIV